MGFSLSKVVKSIPAVKVVSSWFGGDSQPTNLLEQTKWYGGNSSGSNFSFLNPVVQGAVGLGQDILSGWWNTKQQQKLNDNAFQQNLQMWNLQNQYNDPVAQMQRLEKAGLNKNIVYGGGNVTGNTTSNYPTYEPVKYSGVGSFLSRNQQRQIAMAQLDLGMKEFQQRVTNQGIQNGIAIEKLGLYRKINDAMLKNYKETTRSKRLANDFFENPLDNVNTGSGLGMILKILQAVN